MTKNSDDEHKERSSKDRRDDGADDRREGDHVTVQKLFNDYGFEDERKDDSRRGEGDSRRKD